MCSLSPLQQARLGYQPKLPVFLNDFSSLYIERVPSISHSHSIPAVAAQFPHTSRIDTLHIKQGRSADHFPLKVGLVLSGGQAPGGHNVISGIYDALKKLNKSSLLFGFLDGPGGIVKNKYVEITDQLLSHYRNQGGFDIIGSGRTKIESPEQFAAAEVTVRSLDLDGLIIIGGDDSNTNAAFLAEYFASHDCKTSVIGIPKTIDGDLKNKDVEISFGFDTASKTYSDIIGNIMRDALSAKKYYYFIKLMGRSASHITLECALQTHPNIALIAEEISRDKKTLTAVISDISDVICRRAEQGKDYGVILIPEGIIEFISEFKVLIKELNTLLSSDKNISIAAKDDQNEEKLIDYAMRNLSEVSKQCFKNIPRNIQTQLLLGRDPHGNVQVSKIETERLIIELVAIELAFRKKQGMYSGNFNAQPLFCGYEGRSCLPSNFDCNYCYALGHAAALLVDAKASGYMGVIKHLSKSIEDWEVCAIPLMSMMNIEERDGKSKTVIAKALVDLNDLPFATFKEHRNQWALEDRYLSPGPIQFFGPSALSDSVTQTLRLEHVR